MTRTRFAALAVACLAALGTQVLPPRPADAAEDPYAGVEVLRGLFTAIDYNRDGQISAPEFQVYTELVFVSMDTNNDSRVSRAEFMAWDPGFASLAEERGKVQAFNAAKLGEFEAWDRKGGGSLGRTEMFVNAAHDFVNADQDRNGSLSPQEFATGFPLLAAIAKALR